MKGVFVILDGAADESSHALGMATPLKAAKTPHLDFLAKKSSIDHCYVVGEGIAPESSGAFMSLLGYDPNLCQRGPLEALGAGVPFRHGDLVFRANFATVDDISTLNLLDRRAGRTLSTKEAQVLARLINEKVKLPYKFQLHPTVQHRAVLVFRGGFSDNISNVDPHYSSGNVSSGNKVKFSSPLDDNDSEARVASDLVNMFARRSFDVLDSCSLNKTRARKGLYSANFLLCRDPGVQVPRLNKLKGSWMAMAYMPLEVGIAKAAKMDIYSFSYPKMRGIDVYANLYSGLKKATKKAVKMIKKYSHKYDYFLVHFKETDIPGHDNKPVDKMKMLELLDKRFFSFLVPFAMKNKARVVLTCDHTTSCKLKAHTDKPVPLLFYNPSSEIDKEHRFTEEHGLSGKKLIGRKVLEKTLFS